MSWFQPLTTNSWRWTIGGLWFSIARLTCCVSAAQACPVRRSFWKPPSNRTRKVASGFGRTVTQILVGWTLEISRFLKISGPSLQEEPVARKTLGSPHRAIQWLHTPGDGAVTHPVVVAPARTRQLPLHQGSPQASPCFYQNVKIIENILRKCYSIVNYQKDLIF